MDYYTFKPDDGLDDFDKSLLEAVHRTVCAAQDAKKVNDYVRYELDVQSPLFEDVIKDELFSKVYQEKKINALLIPKKSP
jgi:hypothetical protein